MPESTGDAKKSVKKSKSKKQLDTADLKTAVPPHILNIVQNVDKRSKSRKADHERRKQDAMDSIALIRTMMSSVRTKYDLDVSNDDIKKDKENDIKLISNARDIFKHLESQENTEPEVSQKVEKVKRVEVNSEFLLSGQNKAEELRKERLREMAAMKAAREAQLEEEERMRVDSANKADELRKQREREMEVMKMQRQLALEEEERMEAMNRERFQQREISPGLAAARQGIKMPSRETLDGEDRIERMRLEREMEVAEMRRARANQLQFEEDDNMNRTRKSEATRELEAFRASQGGHIRERYNEDEREAAPQRGQGGLARAPKSRAKISNNWIKNQDEDKVEEMKRAREREMEMLMEARNQAIEDEEEERMMAEMARREEADRKAREMAMLVAQLQKMRSETAREADEDERMTRYQEEMLQRVMELHAIAQGGLPNIPEGAMPNFQQAGMPNMSQPGMMQNPY